MLETVELLCQLMQAHKLEY